MEQRQSKGDPFSRSLSVIKHVLELEAREQLHTFIYIDEAGLNLANGRRRGRNHIGKNNH